MGAPSMSQFHRDMGGKPQMPTFLPLPLNSARIWVPHPCRSFMRQGWDTTEAGPPHVWILKRGNAQTFPTKRSLPDKRHKAIFHFAFIFQIARQISCEQFLFVENPPYHHRHKEKCRK